MGGHIRVINNITIQPGGTFQKNGNKRATAEKENKRRWLFVASSKGQPSGKHAGEATNNTT